MRLMRVKQGLLPIMAALLMQGPVLAQTSADAALLEMRDAFRRNVSPQHLVTVVVGGDGDKAAPRNGSAP